MLLDTYTSFFFSQTISGIVLLKLYDVVDTYVWIHLKLPPVVICIYLYILWKEVSVRDQNSHHHHPHVMFSISSPYHPIVSFLYLMTIIKLMPGQNNITNNNYKRCVKIIIITMQLIISIIIMSQKSKMNSFLLIPHLSSSKGKERRMF